MPCCCRVSGAAGQWAGAAPGAGGCTVAAAPAAPVAAEGQRTAFCAAVPARLACCGGSPGHRRQLQRPAVSSGSLVLATAAHDRQRPCTLMHTSTYLLVCFALSFSPSGPSASPSAAAADFDPLGQPCGASDTSHSSTPDLSSLSLDCNGYMLQPSCNCCSLRLRQAPSRPADPGAAAVAAAQPAPMGQGPHSVRFLYRSLSPPRWMAPRCKTARLCA